MATSSPTSIPTPHQPFRNVVHALRGTIGTTLALLAVVALAAALRLGNLQEIGQANPYYTAAVQSMLHSWHNFFFVAAEPGGAVSVDKPPVGLWLQVAAAYLLGVSGVAVVLPNILCGIASVVLVFHLVRRSFGSAAGVLAAVVLAVTPVAIAVERNNTPDAALICTLLLAAWAFLKATETSRLRWLVLGAALVGVGVNIKMLQAVLPLPAFYGLYLLGSAQPWRRKIAHVAVATLVLVPVALSWATIVDLTPADQRPFVGSTQNDSVYSLMFGYNGIERLEGHAEAGRRSQAAESRQTGPSQIESNLRPSGNGKPGVFRLFRANLAAQDSWLLPFGLLMLAAMTASVLLQRRFTSARARGLILWGGWLLACIAFFSVAGFFHQYYLAMMGPPLAVLVAMGAQFVWRLRRVRPARAALLLLAGVSLTLVFQAYTVTRYDGHPWWLALPVILGSCGMLLLLTQRRNTRLTMGLLVASLLIVPAVWSGFTTLYVDTSSAMTMAYAGRHTRASVVPFGPHVQQGGSVPGAAQSQAGLADRSPDTHSGFNQTMLAYLQAHTQHTKYLVVVSSADDGEQYVLATGRPVLYAGGFSGTDPVVDGDGMARLAAAGDVRYVLWGGPGGDGVNAHVTDYLQAACSMVHDDLPTGQAQLYRCGP